jgi:glycosyltransferase involved in cell wall biosynthesis
MCIGGGGYRRDKRIGRGAYCVRVPRPTTPSPSGSPEHHGLRPPAPVVTVGIPAYNRPATLARAIRSALAQEHRAIEVVVSDDASPDPKVARVANELAAADPRVTFTRQRVNLGHAANYQWVLDAAEGEYFMWLADDDWIDPGYVARCLATFRVDPAATMVCGLARYYRDGEEIGDERAIELTSAQPAARVARYFAQVSMNGPLFSVMRTAAAREVGFPEMLGGDWLLVAAMAARGTVRTLSDVHVHRSAIGIGADARGLAEGFGLSGFGAANHHLVLAVRYARAILAGPPYFGPLLPVTRPLVAAATVVSIVTRFTLAEWARRALGPRRAARIEAAVSARLRS